jgi:hypothetical protein
MRSYPQPRVAAISSGERTRPRVLAMASSPLRTFKSISCFLPLPYLAASNSARIDDRLTSVGMKPVSL